MTEAWRRTGGSPATTICRLAARIATALALGLAGLAPASAWAAPDNLLGAFGDPLRLVHMFSAADGSTQIEEITLPSVQEPHGIVRSFFSGAATNVELHTYRNGQNSPWRYARREGPEDTGHVVILLQGELVIRIGETREYRVAPGTLMFNDDHAGRGHQTKCENGSGRDCLILQMDLVHAHRKLLLPKR